MSFCIKGRVFFLSAGTKQRRIEIHSLVGLNIEIDIGHIVICHGHSLSILTIGYALALHIMTEQRGNEVRETVINIVP